MKLKQAGKAQVTTARKARKMEGGIKKNCF